MGSILTAEGLALWLPQHIENAGNARYRANTQRAAALKLRLFSPTGVRCGAERGLAAARCGSIGTPTAATRPTRTASGCGSPTTTPSTPSTLGGWWLRDSSLRRYTFPPEAVIAPGGRLEVTVGRRGDEQVQFAWGRGGPVFDNVSIDGTELGDGAYLFDPLGNVRASMIYPAARPAAIRCRTRSRSPHIRRGRRRSP